MTGQERWIVVSLDGSGSKSKAALRWVIRQAKLTESSVEAVTAWCYPAAYGLTCGTEATFDFEASSRGHGAFASALLGSVSMYCVLYAHCPVLVFRDGRETSARCRAKPRTRERAGLVQP
jgi:hypothetical protein